MGKESNAAEPRTILFIGIQVSCTGLGMTLRIAACSINITNWDNFPPNLYFAGDLGPAQACIITAHLVTFIRQGVPVVEEPNVLSHGDQGHANNTNLC